MRKSLVSAAVLAFSTLAAASARAQSLTFLADLNLPPGIRTDSGDTFGGISGIDYDPIANVLFAISDDKGDDGNPRYYDLHLELQNGAPAVGITKATTLLTAAGQPFALRTIDPEGIALLAQDDLFVSSEGNQTAAPRIAPTVYEFHRDGSQIRELAIPAEFVDDDAATPAKGVRDNEAFEGLSLTPDHQYLFVGTEAPLYQDGDEPSFDHGGDVRILRYRLDGEQRVLAGEFMYHLEPTFRPEGHPNAEDGGNGLSDVLALNDHELIVIERGGIAEGDAWTSHVALYHVDLTIASDVTGLPEARDANYVVAKKELMLDLNDIIPRLMPGYQSIDNIEGISFGPTLPNGHKSLILISDDNFSNDQRTQVLSFDVGE